MNNKNWQYSFSINVSDEFGKRLREAFNERAIVITEDPEVLKTICEILWRHDFRPARNGMVRQSTGCIFGWECLAKYKTVVDFQLDWPYA